jgi:integrase
MTYAISYGIASRASLARGLPPAPTRDEIAGVIRVTRKQVGGKVGPVSRKKRAPTEYPVEPELAEVLREHRRCLHGDVDPKSVTGWMFPTRTGTLRVPSSMDKAWEKVLKVAKITKRFTLHGLRYTFTDLVRRANVDAVVRRALTGHVTEDMQRHYSSVGMDEKRAAIAGITRLMATLPEPPSAPESPAFSLQSGGKSGGNEEHLN